MSIATRCPNCGAPAPVPQPQACPHCRAAYAGAAGATSSGGFGAFLRENWIWIVAPIAVAVILVVVLAVFFQNDDTSPFIYSIF
jgi:hypothetical protein